MPPKCGDLYISLHHPSQPHFSLLIVDLSSSSSTTRHIRTAKIETSFNDQLVEIHITSITSGGQTTFTFTIRGHSRGRTILATGSLLMGDGFRLPSETERPFTTQTSRIERTGKTLRGQMVARDEAEGQEYSVRVLAFITKDVISQDVWSVVRLGELFYTLGGVKVSLEVEDPVYILVEERRKVRKGNMKVEEEGKLVLREGSWC